MDIYSEGGFQERAVERSVFVAGVRVGVDEQPCYAAQKNGGCNDDGASGAV